MTVMGPFGFLAGLNTKSGPYDATPNSYVDGQNMELKYGRMVKKNGNIQWSGAALAAAPIIGLGFYQTVLVGATAAKIGTFSSTTSGGSWTTITGAYPGGTTNVWMDSLNNILVIGSIGNAPVQWSGAGNTTALAAAPQNCACGVMCNNYMFVANNTTYPHRVFWSNPEDPTTWPANNYVDVLVNDSSTQSFGVQAILPFGENLLIGKYGSISMLYTNQISGSLGPLITLTQSFGIAGPHCIDRLPDGRVVFYGTNNHVYIYDGNSFLDISDIPNPGSNIQTLLNALSYKSAGVGIGFVRVYRAKNQIWISYPLTWTSNLGNVYAGVIFIYDINNQIWLPPYVDTQSTKAVNYIYNNAEYLITGAYDGNLYQEDTGGNNNYTSKQFSTFDAYITESIVIGADSKQFIPRSVYFGINATSFSGTVYYGTNGYSTPASSYGMVIPGTTQAQTKKVIPMVSSSKVCDTVQIRFDGAVSNQYFEIAPFYISDQIESQI